MADQISEYPIKGELYSVERLEEYAAFLAAKIEVTRKPKARPLLLPRMRENGIRILSCYRALTEAIHRKETLPPAAEWLTDNFHIVEDQLREIQEDLPPAFYKELPKIALGDLAGYPRIYAIALALVAHTDSQLETDTIRRFVAAYQKVSPLTIGELWALAITLRLALVENLRRISLRIVRDFNKRILANTLADELFAAVADKTAFQLLVSKLPTYFDESDQNEGALLAQFAKRLRDQEPELWPALEYLQNRLAKEHSSIEKVVDLSHQTQASNQVTVANIITSMRLLSSLDWQDFFESLSCVDRILGKDAVYGKMDFLTRDRYRHVIEKLSKKTRSSEIEIADKAIALAQESLANSPGDAKKSHVGYYLIGRGLRIFEAKVGCRVGTRLSDLALYYPKFVYFGLMALFLASISSLFIHYANAHGASILSLVGIGFLTLVPSSELAICLSNLILTHVIGPKHLAKLDLSKGIPQGAKTMVVVPCMLSGAQMNRELLEKLEIHFLGNDDKEFSFALLTDFTDAPAEFSTEDDANLGMIIDGIAGLNGKYAEGGQERFFLFHRRRRWNPSERVWMGWERKRGKIHEFNAVLRGATQTSFVDVTAPPQLLSQIRYVITLDADTQLPRDAARKLVGTALHPLNQARFDETLGRVTEGYGVLQPRIGVSLESSTRSSFAKVFSGYTGIDPYTTAVSDIYQDLFLEGSYTGKGLYDVDAFKAALDNRVPENSILSHDLFEGLYARTGLLTDVELLDDFPQTYRGFFTREHRWTRGDWQIAPWLFPFVRDEKNRWTRNRLSFLSRWKIFDNLRRSLFAPVILVWLVLAWTVLPGAVGFWVGCAFLMIILPCVAHPIWGVIANQLRAHAAETSASAVKLKVVPLQILLYLLFLPHQAYIQSDAVIRVAYRKLISKADLLEWSTAAQCDSQKSHFSNPLWQRYWPTELLLGLAGLFVISARSSQLLEALILLALWMCYPIVADRVSRRCIRAKKLLNIKDRLLMRQVARRTWHYFEAFVGADDNWLPPDNHQESPQPLTAHRTSPTNIGIYLLSLSSSLDLGYLSATNFLRLLAAALDSLSKLEKYEGHYLNWYDTKTLQPLNPKYVSTVDSGNLAGYLLAVKQACLEIPSGLAVNPKSLEGLRDTLLTIEAEIKELDVRHRGLVAQFQKCRQLLASPSDDKFSSWSNIFNRLETSLEIAKANVTRFDDYETQKHLKCVVKWADVCLVQLHEIQNEIAVLAPWTTEAFSDLGSKLSTISDGWSSAWQALIESLDSNVSLSGLSDLYIRATASTQEIMNGTPLLLRELSEFIAALTAAKAHVTNLVGKAETSAQFMEEQFKTMNFGFLLNQERGVFSIGYSVTDGKFDSGLYDLLGSEARLASFVAIAKGDVPQKHWLRLGRQLVPTHEGRALISWTGSMFEYLMPLLVMRDYPNTLLTETVHSVVKQQIKYGADHHLPWGISEAGYNARDLQMNYQYGPFGIPGLGLKRGLSGDMVISPYSTALAAMVEPVSALKNMKSLMGDKLLRSHGFFESVDYTPGRLPENQKFAVIKSFMAHHQGMTLVSINNVINDNVIQNRFHSDLRVRATHLLLQERIPSGVMPRLPKAAEIELEGDTQAKTTSFARHYTDPKSPTPRIQLLSNRHYSLMISTAGGGYSKCGNIAVSRWREDATRDNWGNFIFIRDPSRAAVWSTAYQPFSNIPHMYKVTFSDDRVEFQRRDGDISTCTQILVAPEDNVEIRHVTLTNHSAHARDLEITSYLEPVLVPAANDLDHLAFSKLFIETEFLPSKNALLAKRRKRSDHDTECWGLHVVVTDGEMLSGVEYETDRARFIGRGRSLANAAALFNEENLSNTSRESLDPIFALRVKVSVPPNGKREVAFTTGMASSREEALELADHYHDIHSFDRECKLAWTKSQVDMRHLNIDSEAAYLYNRLAERILYSDPSLRPPAHTRATNTNKQSSLWPSGISGDLPIVAVRISDTNDLHDVRKLLRCHEYLRLKGLIYDFVVINDDGTSYFQGLQGDLLQLIRTTGSQEWLNKNGGVFILRTDVTPAKDIAHIQSVARVSLSADQPLQEQINRNPIEEKYPAPLSLTAHHGTYPIPPVSDQRLEFFNGLGGFSPNGREYVIVMRAGLWTPAPWINVIGNRLGFGFQVSETGSGFTWSLNSQTNRLTPWSNDPVSDPPGEIVYLRDDDTGEIWTPTPLPIRSDAPYVIRHGQGYTSFEHSDHGLEHTLTLFVPKDDSVKISLLRLKNLTNKTRRISLTTYTEWVLGSLREKTAPNLVCDVDQESGAIFARNPYDNEFADKVAFADIGSPERTFTCSRKEFIGRYGTYTSPAALKRDGLSQKKGTGQDPCAVLQTSIELKPGEEREISFLLGQCENSEAARKLALRYRDLKVVKTALKDVIDDWNKILSCVQVKTPEPSQDILMNSWLLYQTVSCRYWSRTAFYQSGGAYGFRDQLQDCMAFVYSVPHLAREHILRACGRQFKEGDVQHWWHPPTGRGIRTRMSDDLLWLPFVVSFYVNVTGDKSILSEKVPFLEAPLLRPEEEDSYTLPKISDERVTVFEHCCLALNHSLPLGQHELPLIGTGDWNDGMNRVGSLGKGESIWLGWFLYKVLGDFLPFCDQPDGKANRDKYEAHMKKLKAALEKAGWDGEWYKRAYFDDGTPLGSVANEECRIDSIAQSWAVISGAGDAAHAAQAMDKVEELLIHKESALILLFTPPFDKTPKDPGYIKGYVPGVRENGGQYTHAATWVVMAYAELGDGDKACELFTMLNPIRHSSSDSKSEKYKNEAYVLSGDVYSGGTLEGRGGWSWYTGSSSWFYRVGLESILGFRLRGDKLKLAPCISKEWKRYEISFVYGNTKYFIEVSNPHSVCGGNVTLEIDGTASLGPEIHLTDDGKEHKIKATLQGAASETISSNRGKDQNV